MFELTLGCCPFCGNAHPVTEIDYLDKQFRIYCDNLDCVASMTLNFCDCGLGGGSIISFDEMLSTLGRLVSMWNSRHTDSVSRDIPEDSNEDSNNSPVKKTPMWVVSPDSLIPYIFDATITGYDTFDGVRCAISTHSLRYPCSNVFSFKSDARKAVSLMPVPKAPREASPAIPLATLEGRTLYAVMAWSDGSGQEGSWVDEIVVGRVFEEHDTRFVTDKNTRMSYLADWVFLTEEEAEEARSALGKDSNEDSNEDSSCAASPNLVEYGKTVWVVCSDCMIPAAFRVTVDSLIYEDDVPYVISSKGLKYLAERVFLTQAAARKALSKITLPVASGILSPLAHKETDYEYIKNGDTVYAVSADTTPVTVENAPQIFPRMYPVVAETVLWEHDTCFVINEHTGVCYLGAWVYPSEEAANKVRDVLTRVIRALCANPAGEYEVMSQYICNDAVEVSYPVEEGCEAYAVISGDTGCPFVRRIVIKTLETLPSGDCIVTDTTGVDHPRKDVYGSLKAAVSAMRPLIPDAPIPHSVSMPHNLSNYFGDTCHSEQMWVLLLDGFSPVIREFAAVGSLWLCGVPLIQSADRDFYYPTPWVFTSREDVEKVASLFEFLRK